jgi:glycerol-3-phosphate acyltransferase PlsY
VNIWIGLGAAFIGYLFGAVSFTRIVGARVVPGEDLSYSEFPMGETTLRIERTSASLISMKKGPAYGCMTGLLDMAKAAIPVLAFKLAFPDHDYEFLTAAMAVVGHNFPVYYRFRGGGGMSPYLGGLAVLDWLAVPALTVAGILTGAALRNAMLAYISGVIWLIPWFAWRDGGWPSLLYAVIVNIAVWVAVWPTLKELARKRRAGEIDPKGVFASLREGHPSMNRDNDQPDE